MGVESFRAVGEAADDILMGAIAERWRVMLQEKAVAGGVVSFSPAGDAAALRRLIRSRNTGSVPADTITRMWRALSGDIMVARGLKAVHVAGGDLSTLMQGARGYFGFAANIQPAMEIREALEKADQTPGVLACVPWPEHAGAGQWWPILNENRFRNLVIVAGWPSLPDSPDAAPRVAVVGRMPVEPSGEDDMLATCHDDRHQATQVMASLGLKAEVAARARSLTLLRVSEFVAPDDRRLELARKAGLDGLRIVGVRPRP
jgi:hypothetical protein